MAYCNLFLADRLAVGLETYSRTPCQKSLDFLHHCKQSLHRIELLHNPYLNFDNNFNKNGYQTKLFCVRCNILEFLIWHDLPWETWSCPWVCRPLQVKLLCACVLSELLRVTRGSSWTLKGVHWFTCLNRLQALQNNINHTMPLWCAGPSLLHFSAIDRFWLETFDARPPPNPKALA